jgi:hypothetical protein
MAIPFSEFVRSFGALNNANRLHKLKFFLKDEKNVKIIRNTLWRILILASDS